MAVKRSGMHRVDAGRLPNHSLSLSILVPASSLILPFMVNAPYRAKGLFYRHAVLVFALPCRNTYAVPQTSLFLRGFGKQYQQSS